MTEGKNKNDGQQQPANPVRIKISNPFDLQTDQLGTIKVGRMTIKALTELSPNLDPMKDTDDAILVRAMLGAVSKLPTNTDSEDARKFTDAELQLITDADLDRFATAFMDQEKWEADKDETGQPLRPVPALASAFRFHTEELGATTRKMMEGLKGVISPATQDLFMRNAALSERLKELGGVKPIFSSSLMEAMKKLHSPLLSASKMAGILGANSAESGIKGLNLGLRSHEGADVLSVEPVKPPQIDFAALHENSPVNRTAKTVAELKLQAEEIAEIARGMAVAHGNTNEMVGQAMAQFEAKRISDTKDIKDSLKISSRNLTVATWSLVASVLIGVVSLGYTIGSYQIAKNADLTSGEQTQTLKDVVMLQRDQNARLQARVDALEAKIAKGPEKHESRKLLANTALK